MTHGRHIFGHKCEGDDYDYDYEYDYDDSDDSDDDQEQTAAVDKNPLCFWPIRLFSREVC